MKALLCLLVALPALAAVTGTVRNGTTGKPQSNTAVTLYTFAQGRGMEAADKTTTDAQGNFTIAKVPAAPGPKMLRVEVDGVTYNKLVTPNMSTEGLAIDVYNASKQPAGAKVSKHMLLFEPANGQMRVNETLLVENTGKTTWNDPQNGTIHFFLPAGSNGTVDAKGTAPDGMAVPIPTDKTGKPDIYTAKFEIKPGGVTRFDLTYTVPYNIGDAYAGKIASQDDNTYLIAPNGVTLQGEGLTDLNTEPRTQAHIYGLSANSYKISLTGAEVAAPAAAPDQADNSGPQIEQIMPRVNSQTKAILAISLGILALGFALLYRASDSKETHERGRR